MEYILYISRFLYRIRWWLLLGTIAVTVMVYMVTGNLSKSYNVNATIYTGVISGYSLEENSGKIDWATSQNAIDNLINIIQAESTLQRVSMRLYARTLIYGNPDEDNEYITAAHYRDIYNHLKNSPKGAQVLALIDKTSEERTVANLFRYMRPNRDNYIYGLFYFNHPYYSYNALSKIKVSRKGASDLLEVNYTSSDPGISYNTISILMEEFVNEYRTIRYGETDKVIDYFKGELDRIGKDLRGEEDALTDYNIEKRIINYYDETKEVAAINKEYELREQEALAAFNSTKVMLTELEKQMDQNTKQLLTNMEFVSKLKEASTLTGKISEMETVSNNATNGPSTQSYKDRLKQAQKELTSLSNQYVANKFTKEGVSRGNIIDQWLEQTLQHQKAESDLRVIMESRRELNEKYAFFAPVGSTIKRKERSISFIEENYLSLLKSYNDALMRKKNLEMTSATIKVLNRPAFPISAEPTGRKKIVMTAFAGTFLFILGFFLILELIDHTLRDSVRAFRLTKLPILGAFPAPSFLKRRQLNKICEEIATKQLSNSILRQFKQKPEGRPYMVDFISTERGDGKSLLIEQLTAYWSSIGLKVRKLKWGEDFDTNSRQYLLAQSVSDIYTFKDEDILLIEYPSLKENSIPEPLVNEADLNLLVARVNRGWKETDNILVDKLKRQIAPQQLYLYLTQAPRYVVQDYTGMLPPYTFIRQQLYRLSQLAFTEKTIYNFARKNKKGDDQE